MLICVSSDDVADWFALVYTLSRYVGSCRRGLGCCHGNGGTPVCGGRWIKVDQTSDWVG